MSTTKEFGKLSTAGKLKPVKKAKDPNAPKRPQGAFFLFSGIYRAEVKAKNPDFKLVDVARELGKMWADAAPEVKAKYQKEGAEAKAKWEVQNASYKLTVTGVEATTSDADSVGKVIKQIRPKKAKTPATSKA